MPLKRALHYPEDFCEDPDFVMDARQLEFFNKFVRLIYEAGARPKSSYYINSRSPFWFYCRDCGAPHYIKWDQVKGGSNPNFLCPDCLSTASPSIDFLDSLFVLRGAVLLTRSYINGHQKLYYLCPCCHRQHFISWNHLRTRPNSTLLCPSCSKNAQPDFEDLKTYFSRVGSVLLTMEYRNGYQPLFFTCSRCGAVHHTSWNNIRKGRNLGFLCSKCNLLSRVNPYRVDFTQRNTEFGGTHWYSYIQLFFNIKEGPQGISIAVPQPYSSHHIMSYDNHPLLRSSICNGFPVLKDEIHFRNLSGGNAVIHSDKWRSPKTWNSDEFQNKYHSLYAILKLPYHNYPGFMFHDLNEFLVTETFINEINLEVAKDHENYWRNRGRAYIPVSSHTLAFREERLAFFNYIRDELRPFIPEIDLYTGVKQL